MKKIIYLSCFLGLVCAVAGGALTIVNNATAPIIEAMALESEKANLELIYPGANFSEVENTDETGLIKGIYQAEGLGYIYKVENYGYASTPFTFLIAFNNDGTVAGYQVLSSSETSGFGSRCFEEDYSNQVKALTSADAFPLLSGATLTSTGVTNGIDAAKAQSIKFFEIFERNLNCNGAIITDNLKFHGLVDKNDSEIKSRNLRALVRKIKDYIKFLETNEKYNTEFFDIGDGISVSIKK